MYGRGGGRGLREGLLQHFQTAACAAVFSLLRLYTEGKKRYTVKVLKPKQRTHDPILWFRAEVSLSIPGLVGEGMRRGTGPGERKYSDEETCRIGSFYSFVPDAAGCAPAGTGGGDGEEARLTVLASTYPVYLAARSVAEGVEGVSVLRLETGQCPASTTIPLP